MFETNIVVVGNVLTAPEWRRTSNHTLVANFRVASTARRFDRGSGRWVDGDHLRVRVNCWRRLAIGVGASITVGDPIVVVGRLFTRDWKDGDGNLRTSYEMEAMAVGHDLARGKAKFFRTRPTVATSEIEVPEAIGQVRGEPAELVSGQEVPAGYGDGIPDEEEPPFVEVSPGDLDPANLDPANLDPAAALIGAAAGPEEPDEPPRPDDAEGDDLAPVDGEIAPVKAESAGDGPEIVIDVESLGVPAPAPRRPRRPAKRQPVPA